MDCYPPCAACTGLCKQAAPRRKTARRVAPPHSYPLLTLSCKHKVDDYGSIIDTLGSVLGAKVWCPRCGDWRKPARKTPYKPKPQPQNPMF